MTKIIVFDFSKIILFKKHNSYKCVSFKLNQNLKEHSYNS